MAFIFRIKRIVNGRAVQSRKFYVRFRDPVSGRLVTRAGYEDREATKQLAARLVKEAARHAEGLGPAPAVVRADDLTALRAAFKQSRLDFGRTEKHANLTDQRLRDLFTGCGWRTSRELDAAQAMRWLAERRSMEGQGKQPGRQWPRFGIASTNHYLRAVKMFGRWLSRRVRGYDALAELELLNAEPDKRHERRALTLKEMYRFFQCAAESAKMFRGLSGRDRASLYQTAAFAGFRRSELARLTPADLDFELLAIFLSARQKNRRKQFFPMHETLVSVLREQCKGRAASDPLWPGSWPLHTRRMMADDLKAAGIARQTAAGIIDLHSLRVTFITNLARAGVEMIPGSKLARHTDPRLTAAIYTKLDCSDLAAQLRKLPKVQ